MKNLKKKYNEFFLLQEEYGGLSKPVNESKPLVSVVTSTYQHAPYIRQCLDSIVSQNVDFPFELIIGEDGSTDGTREICIEYAKRYPEKIRLFLRDRRISHYTDSSGRDVRLNSLFSVESARGKYIALCEGDDYWIDNKKLAKQVDILEKNKSISFCSHNYVIFDEKKSFYENSPQAKALKRYPDTFVYEIENPLGWIWKTLTLMYRKEFFPSEFFLDYRYWRDVHLNYYLFKKGPAIHLNEVMGVYRRTYRGIVSSLSNKQAYYARVCAYGEIYQKEKSLYVRRMLFDNCLRYIKESVIDLIKRGHAFKLQEFIFVVRMALVSFNFDYFCKKNMNCLKKKISERLA